MEQSKGMSFPKISGPVLSLYILTFVAALIMLPTAFANWYSKCFKISMLYGFAIVFSSAIVALVSSIFPEDISNVLHHLNGIVMCCVIIYGVFLQLTGKCDFGIKL